MTPLSKFFIWGHFIANVTRLKPELILIDMFCTILIHCQPTDPKDFYFHYQNDLCMHLMKRDRVNEPSDIHVNEVRKIIKRRVESEGFKLEQFGIPEPEVQ